VSATAAAFDSSGKTGAGCHHGGVRGSAPDSAQPPSSRAQRSNPDCRRGKILDCFAALAM